MSSRTGVYGFRADTPRAFVSRSHSPRLPILTDALELSSKYRNLRSFVFFERCGPDNLDGCQLARNPTPDMDLRCVLCKLDTAHVQLSYQLRTVSWRGHLYVALINECSQASLNPWPVSNVRRAVDWSVTKRLETILFSKEVIQSSRTWNTPWWPGRRNVWLCCAKALDPNRAKQVASEARCLSHWDFSLSYRSGTRNVTTVSPIIRIRFGIPKDFFL